VGGLTQGLGGQGRLFYRRRPLEPELQSGKPWVIFCVVGARITPIWWCSNADSLMSGDCWIRMVQLNAAPPAVGYFCRAAASLMTATRYLPGLQQFFHQLYGPCFTTGLAASSSVTAAFLGAHAILLP